VSHAERAPNLLAHLRQYGVKVETASYDDAAAREAVKEHRKPFVLVVMEDFGSRFKRRNLPNCCCMLTHPM